MQSAASLSHSPGQVPLLPVLQIRRSKPGYASPRCPMGKVRHTRHARRQRRRPPIASARLKFPRPRSPRRGDEQNGGFNAVSDSPGKATGDRGVCVDRVGSVSGHVLHTFGPRQDQRLSKQQRSKGRQKDKQGDHLGGHIVLPSGLGLCIVSISTK